MRTTWSSRPAATIAAVAACLLVAGCGGGAVATEASTTADPDGHLRIGYVIPPAALNPHAMASDIGAYSYLTPVYDRLTQIRSDGESAEVAPMVASEWAFGDDGMSVTFTLREDVTFSDGAVLDADAVKANFDHALTSPGTTVAPILSMIDAVEVVTPTQVRFDTNRPAADLLYVLAGAAGSLISPQALDNPDLDVNPVGSGPYVATSIRVGDSVTYKRREGYWDPEAQKAETVTITGMPDENARLNALRSGQIDMAYTMLTSYPAASSLGNGFGFHSYPESTMYSVALNTARPNMSDPRFRQALNFAVDREGISRTLTNDQCVPNSQPVAANARGHLAEPPVAYEYDPDRARALLREAGIENATVSLLVPTGLSLQEDIASALQAQFADIGVELAITKGDTVTSSVQYAEGRYDAYLNARVPGLTPAQTLDRNYLSPRAFPGPISPELQSAVQAAYDPTLGDEGQLAALERGTSIVTDQAFDVFICSAPTQFAYSDAVLNIDSMGISHLQTIFDPRYLGIATTN